MTDIEQKALALLNEVLAERVHWQMTGNRTDNASIEALCRAIKQHEAFRQEVSDALMSEFPNTGLMPDRLSDFIIAKPDPLVEALDEITWTNGTPEMAIKLRAALKARGYELSKIEGEKQ